MTTTFPPSSCNAWEDCNHDGLCHDPQGCGGSMTEETKLVERLEQACVDWTGDYLPDGAEPMDGLAVKHVREAAATLRAKEERIAALESALSEMAQSIDRSYEAFRTTELRALSVEAKLSKAVEALRKIGGLDVGSPPFIETVEGYGAFAVMTARAAT